MQLRKQEEKQRPKPRKRLKNGGLWRRRRSWGISNNSGMRYSKKKLLFWKGLKDPRLQNPNTRKLLPEMRRGNSLLKRLERNNQGVLQRCCSENGDANPYEKCVSARQDCLVYPSRWVFFVILMIIFSNNFFFYSWSLTCTGCIALK